MASRRQATPTKPASSVSLGFPQEGFRFLRDLKANNDREWFRERKNEYATFVEEPMKQIVLAASAECRAKGLPLFAKDKNPVMRVYRDIRFSKDKRPFKTHVSAELRRSFNVSSWGGVYLHISPDESFVAAGFWEPERSSLLAWREAIIKDPAAFERMHRTLAKHDLDFSSEYVLSTMPRGLAQYADQPIARWLRYKSFVVSRPLKSSEYTSPAFVRTIVDFALASRTLLEYGWRMEDTNPQAGGKIASADDLW